MIISFFIHLLAVFNFSLKHDYKKSALTLKENKVKITKIILAPKKKLQVVDSEESKNKLKPIDPKFLGKNDQQFEKQTIADNVGKFQRAGEKNLNVTVQKKSNASNAVSQNRYKQYKQKKSNRKISFKDLMFNSQNRHHLDRIAKEAVANSTQINSSKQLGVSSRSDHVEDIPLGRLTQLNTSKYRFHSFLTRFKEQMEGHWRVNVKRYAERGYLGRMPASSNGFKTGLKIILDGKGEVVNIMVEQSCGVTDLDQIAVNAIYKAGSFPNPPKDMVVNNRIEIPFGFVVE